LRFRDSSRHGAAGGDLEVMRFFTLRALYARPVKHTSFAILLCACHSAPITGITTPPDVCTHDSDCAQTSLGDDCCDHCEERSMTTKAESDLRTRCRDNHRALWPCPQLTCPYEPSTAKCVSNHCVVVH
jgi:hypothetical protein